MNLNELKAILHYDSETGIWTRVVTRKGSYQAGQRADCPAVAGYRRVRFKKKSYYAHRLAVFYMTGSWPVAVTDHCNRDRADNRWVNIRCATQSQNLANSIKNKRNTGQYKGVCKDKGKWVARITKNRTTYRQGGFKTAYDAHCAYLKKAKELFGEFARAD